ncbi:hypothetical protein C3L23_08540 [Nautilia sp. PV-1]|uniref:glycosyltransferase family 9 protein n=1 Tax=Nautilia sp. PV-1 TaxID=2579250 RepID=UPI000FD9D10A|nr:glycosyltransferase family 9 protein [Nautilia sp. PV-1]AZV47317.1 hypothetical protein C3L23_08540 [Nautilia sp. PV-1]
MKILIIHTYGMGDMIMFTPALKKIKEKYPKAEIDFVVFQKFAINPIKNCDFVKNIYTSDFNIKNIIKTVYFLRKNKYDISFVTSGTSSLKGGLFSFLIGAKERVGEYKKFKNLFYTRTVQYIEKLHRVENNLMLVGCKEKKIKPFICGVNEKKLFNKDIKIGFHIGSNKQFEKKRWEKSKFIKLINKIKSNFGNIETIIFSGPDEQNESQEVAEMTNSKLLLNLPFNRLAKEISVCDVFINTDSGLGHIASCFENIEIFTIFGPAKDYKAKPYSKKAHVIKLGLECQPCYGTDRFKKCKNLECLKNLSVDYVYDFILKNSEVLNNAK